MLFVTSLRWLHPNILVSRLNCAKSSKVQAGLLKSRAKSLWLRTLSEGKGLVPAYQAELVIKGALKLQTLHKLELEILALLLGALLVKPQCVPIPTRTKSMQTLTCFPWSPWGGKNRGYSSPELARAS